MRLICLGLVFISFNCLGQVLQNFSVPNVMDEKNISLEDFSSVQGLVIIFTSVDCPYDNYYMARIQALAETYKTKTPVLLVNANTDESIEQMKKYVSQNNLTLPYLADKELKLKTNLNPRKSPECFLLQKSNGKFTVVYRGAIDDNPQSASSVNHHYLKDAINALLANQKITTSDVRPVGCSLR